MKAVVATAYGPPEKYTVADVPVPRPGPGQIQVRIAAASINPADVRLPGGDFRDVMPLAFPHVPGNDFAGTVSEVGAGVTAYQVGDEIFGQAVPRALRAMAGATRPSLSTGSLAEYAVFEADTQFLAHRPAGLNIEQAAALPTIGLTARALMATAKIQPGETVLVIGATGGVGTAVIPLLAAAKARVIATATDADADILRGLGADQTIGYAEAEYPSSADVAFNLTLPSDHLTAVASAIRPGGRLLTITLPVPRQEWIGRDDVRLHFVLDRDGTFGGMREVGELAVRGELPATIGRRYTLDDGVQACVDFVRLHTTGKLVVTLLEPGQDAVVDVGQVVHAVGVDQQRVGQPRQLHQPGQAGAGSTRPMSATTITAR
ncbi:NADP-dependent oxidoreductase [Micromonospora sp. HM134]|uniref:NADP-dependent oxidoreductase n=1 Tax=Micromonospora sp. HM134 TaxID=2583243 RepID=UPI001198B5CF|nr:NADP-dependent oxidoreductase [Micromonospora sp. HM134]QDY11266.1 NADP-dependent oxidoreductase [Micromonospora sp. HM134]